MMQLNDLVSNNEKQRVNANNMLSTLRKKWLITRKECQNTD